MSVMKKSALFALVVILALFATAVVVATKARAEEKKSDAGKEGEEAHLSLNTEDYLIHCRDKTPGACENQAKLLNRFLEFRRQKRDDRNFQKQIAVPLQGKWMDI